MNGNDHDRHDVDELTAREQEAFAALPRERVPPAELEERVVGTLRREGLLSPGLPRPRVAPGIRGWLVAAAAACLALFASGVATGQWMAARSTAEVVSAVMDGDALSRALQVQQAGSEYVRALARLGDLADELGTEDLAPGREAAQAALHAAALEIGRLAPDDQTIQLVLAVLEERRGPADGGADRTTVWY
ncbi:MAG: hypothetical protein P8170_10535 [Gemmatimonadota bacterium]|jgi:hypothetical protein